MVGRVLLRKLRRDLWHRKGSLLALVAIVGVGVGVFAGMVAVYIDMEGAKQRYYTRCRMADFTVDLKRAPDWTLNVVRRLPNVAAARGRIHQAVMLDLKSRVRPVPGLALSMPAERSLVVNDILMRSGVWFSDGEAREVILDHRFAQANGINIGDRIKVLLRDKQHELLVVGTAVSPEFVYLIPPGGGMSPDPKGYGVMYLPRKFFQHSGDLDGAYNQVAGIAYDSSRDALRRTLTLIKDALDPYGVTHTTPIQDQPSASVLRDELANVKRTAAIFPVIFLGVAALVLNVLLARMVAQQRLVIGTLKALGYSSRDITIHYLAYGAVVGVVGGSLGIGLGWWLQGATLGLYRKVFAMPGIVAHFHAEVFAMGAAIAVLSAIGGAWKGGRRAAGLAPAEAMHPPPPEKGGRVPIERLPWLWNALPFREKMIARSIFRNPFRSSVSVLASAVATVLLVCSFSLYDSVFFLIDYHFRRVAHEDFTLSLRNPKGKRSVWETREFPAVSQVEPQLDIISDLRNGLYERRISLTGLLRNNTLYTPLDRSGSKMIVPDRGVVLSRKLAEILNLSVGDRFRLRPLVGLRRETDAPVVGIVDTYLGLEAFCDLRYLSELVGEYWVANSLLTSSLPGRSERPFVEQLRKLPTLIGITERARSIQLAQESMSQFMGAFFTIMVVFAGIVAFGSLLNTALISVSEREREVGTLRVLGYTPAQVTSIFAGESFALNGIGILLGLALGVGAAHLVAQAFNTDLYRFPAVLEPSRLLLCAALMVVFVCCAEFVMYRLIRGLRWLDVLKIKE